jgi:hypothetical protein
MAGRKAKGTLLQIGDGAGPEVFTTIALCLTIPFPEWGQGTIETTNFDSSDEEHVTDGIQAHGEPEAEILWIPENATQNDTAGALSKAISGVISNYKVSVITATGTKVFAFAASVRFMPSAVSPRDALKARVKFKLTGGVTITTTP